MTWVIWVKSTFFRLTATCGFVVSRQIYVYLQPTIVVIEIITPFAYTTRKIEIWTATVMIARFAISIRVILVVHNKSSTF